MKQQNQVRQGDCFLERVDGPVPAGARRLEREDGRVILLRGEATGHNHAVLEANAVLYLYEAVSVAERYLEVTGGPATLVHEEHGAIVLAPGVYRQRFQREYDEVAERWVAD